MPLRNSDQRRRRTLTVSRMESTGMAPTLSQRELAKFRAANRPASGYGARVNGSLDGRWFDLVPVRNRVLYSVCSASLLLAVGLMLLHYLALTRPFFIQNPTFARIFRADQLGSFPHAATLMSWVMIGGTSLLVYKLRRYRVDDYHGRYRLWKTMTAGSMLIAIGTTTNLSQWLGETIDLLVGRRIGLRGNDWIDLLVAVGGGVMLMRLLADVWPKRRVIGWLALAFVGFAFGQAARWNVVSVQSPLRYTLAASSHLLGVSLLWTALITYLSGLYCDVCELEPSLPLRERFANWRAGLRVDDDEEQAPVETRLSYWQQFKQSREKRREEKANEREAKKREREEAKAAKEEAKRVAADEKAKAASEKKAAAEEKKREAAETRKRAKEEKLAAAKAKKEAAAESRNAAAELPTAPAESSPPQSESHSGDDDVDWNSMSKAERRRMRKQMKRQGRAA
ncbi:MAG: hypothetical protein AAF664_00370 [Planctomycetota bacterium]